MAVHFHAPPQPAQPTPRPQTALPEHDIIVDGTAITAQEVAAEMQHHPAPDPLAAWNAAARALVVRRLLLDAAGAAGGAPGEEDAAIDALLAQEVVPPAPDEAAARRWFAAHPERFGTPEAWDASHILVAADPEDDEARAAAERRAGELLAQVVADPSLLPDLAERHSDCPSRAERGHLGRMERGSTVPEFETFLAATAPGEVCPVVVKSRYGMHVLHLHRHTPPRTPAFEDVRAAVLRDLAGAAWHAAVRQYIAVLAARATIEGFVLGADGEARADGPLVN
jgi:peptidyl-prolyl cis-trans isomerase C